MNASVNEQEKEKVFMSLDKISYGYDIQPRWAVDKWLSEPTTLEFIQLWESLHNLDFKKDEYISVCSEALGIGASPEISTMIHKCGISSIYVDTNHGGEIFAHKDLAIDFASWASPAFRTFCLLIMQDNWDKSEASFKTEEDFIVSSKTLAQFTKANALKNFQSLVGKFVYNCNSV